MATFEDVQKYIADLPETSEGLRWNKMTWLVSGNVFAWHRPLSKADIKRLAGQELPTGELIAVSTLDLDDREAILAADIPGFFTIEHFSNYPAYLIQLDKVGKRALKTALLDGWLAAAPPELAKKHFSR